MSPTSSHDTTWRNDGGCRHALDPDVRPGLFHGVLSRRFFAFLIDLVILTVPIIFGVIFIAFFGIVTLGLGWLLFWLVSPLSVIWAILYYGLSLGGPHSTTIGMRAMELELRTWSGERGYFLLGAAHAVLYWISVSALTPLIVLVGLFNRRRQLLHDLALGTVIVNAREARAVESRAA
jgi:uncharacterized RDD family membrane protein YckC